MTMSRTGISGARISASPAKARVWRGYALAALVASVVASAAYSATSPFHVRVGNVAGVPEQRVEVVIHIPVDHHIYADSLRVRSETGEPWQPVDVPPPKTIFDSFAEENREVYDADFAGIYQWNGTRPATSVVVELQGCDRHVCFFPEEHRFPLTVSGTQREQQSAQHGVSAPASSGGDWRFWADRFRIAGAQNGFLGPDQFLAFLDVGTGNNEPLEDAWAVRLRRAGPWLGALLIVVGGLALNITPCVLPMIPINLAIIGAGARARSKWHGFWLGAAYGLGMTLAYGAVGLVAVLTGSTFGALNASPWFNAIMAVLFCFLALAAFEVILVDFSRFQRSVGLGGSGARFGAVFVLGAISALLAGACVAPVVISVLLLTSALYSQGHVWATVMPFLLGFGMALPWPFAGAGIALLPKPGAWMKWVSRVFGVLISLLAVYYAHNAFVLFRSRVQEAASQPGAMKGAVDGQSVENAKLAAELQRAFVDRKPVLIDFWATWCKNCIAMEKTTFQNPLVKARLDSFVLIKYQAEQPESAATKPVLRYFQVKGLPTYVVLLPSGSERE